ncbi:MAG: hypothetical protein FWE96_01700 [Coriobacteriia bacterium]|nr:hypothetical protein [Coriobacteriia bacterium]
MLCIVLAGALVYFPALDAALAEEGSEEVSTTEEAIDPELTPDADPSLAALEPVSGASSILPFSTPSVEVHIDGEDLTATPGVTRTFSYDFPLELVVYDPSGVLLPGWMVATLAFDDGTYQDIFIDAFLPLGIDTFGLSITVDRSCWLHITPPFSPGNWILVRNPGLPPIVPSNPVPLIYGETNNVFDINNLLTTTGTGSLSFRELIIHDGLGTRVPASNNNPGLFILPPGYSSPALPFDRINVFNYITLSSGGSIANATVTAHAPTEGVIMWDDGNGNIIPCSFSVLIRRGSSSSGPAQDVMIYKPRLYLQHASTPAPHSFVYGQDVLTLANTSIFYGDHIFVSSGSGEPLRRLDTVALSWNLASVFSGGTNGYIGFSSPLSGYPSVGGVDLNWNPSYSYNPNLFVLSTANLSCTFDLKDVPAVDELVLNTENVPNIDDKKLTKDYAPGVFWSRTPDLEYSPAFGYDSFKIGTSLGVDGNLISPFGFTFSTTAVNGCVATNSGDLAILPIDHYAVILDQVKYDGEKPFISSITFEDTPYSLGGYRGYRDTTTVKLEISDEASPGSASEVSGIKSVELLYHDEDYPIVCHEALGIDPAPWNITVEFDLNPSDSRYDLKDFTLIVTDVAGNILDISLEEYYELRIDKVHAVIVDEVDPDAAISLSNNGVDIAFESYNNIDVTVNIEVREAHLQTIKDADPTRVIATITIDERHPINITAIMFENYAEDGYTWEYINTYDEDGEYRVNVDFVDFVDHPLPPPEKTAVFHIDKTLPIILVTFDNENFHSPFYFNAPRLATISVMERNFNAAGTIVSIRATDASNAEVAGPGHSAWVSTSLHTHETTVLFSDDLRYTLSVEATDLAGNSAETVVVDEFIIDMTDPIITIENVLNTQAISGEVVPIVSFFDLNLEGYDARVEITRASGDSAWQFRADEQLDANTKVLAYTDLDKLLENDDVYILTARIVDKAGNAAEQTITFSVNRFGSNYVFSPATAAMAGAYLSKPQEVVVNEINVSGLHSQETVVRVSTESGVSTLAREDDYSVEASLDKALWSHNIYTIPASYFTEDGFYRVLFRSVDHAGNLSENTMDLKNTTRDNTAELAFAIDTTAPIGSIINVEDYGIYNELSVEAQVRVTDNLALASARVLIDGKEVLSYQAEGIETSFTGTFIIPEAEHAQDITLEIVDRAGNTTIIEKNQVFISSDLRTLLTKTPLANWFMGSPLLGLLLGLILVALALAFWFFFVVPFRRKKKEEEDETDLMFAAAEQTEAKESP